MGKVEALFTPIRGHASFKDQAVGLLTDRIMSGKIKPGERLNESSLSQQLGISRAPIREALQQLQEQGLVVNIPRRGMFVVSLGKDDVQKINSLRLVLESEALRLARTYITPQKVKKLGQLMKQIEDAKPDPTTEWVPTDVQTEKQSVLLDTHRPMFDFVVGKSELTAEAVMMAHLSRRWPEPARYSSLWPKDKSVPIASAA